MNQPLSAKSFQQGWLHLHVREFCEQSNWQGFPIISPTSELSLQNFATDVAAENHLETAGAVSGHWLNLTLGQFFADANWDGRQIVARSSSPASINPPAPAGPDFHLSVAEFWGRFPWTGQPAIATLPQAPPPARPAEDSFTLSDLSDLF